MMALIQLIIALQNFFFFFTLVILCFCLIQKFRSFPSSKNKYLFIYLFILNFERNDIYLYIERQFSTRKYIPNRF